MRTAYKAWTGIAVATFLMFASCDIADGDDASRAASSPAVTTQPAPAPAQRDLMLGSVTNSTVGVSKTVTRVASYRDLEFSDGTRARVDYRDLTTESWRGCEERLLNVAANRLLKGQTVTVGRNPTITSGTQDWVRLRGYEGHAGEVDYTTALSAETTTAVMDQCYPPVESSGGSSSGSDTYVDSDDDDGRDGALTGGYCRRKWWC